MGVRARWAAIAGYTLLLAWSEWTNRRWSRTLVSAPEGQNEVVLVPGFRNAQPTANFVNRWRVRAGMRSMDPAAASTLILSGGPIGNSLPEARHMAAYAVDVLGYAGPLEVEGQSQTTWENVRNVVPLLEGADRIKIASQPAHSLKARAYLQRQRPDLAARLAPSAEYRVGEWLLLKPLLAAYGYWSLRGICAAEQRSGVTASTVEA